MIALVVMAFFAVYLGIAVALVKLAARWAKNNNRRPWLWGGLVAFAMYNLVFYDWVPTLVTHKYYCATEAGFWVYKTREQWVKENPGVLETLIADKKVSSMHEGDMNNHIDTYTLNSRFNWAVKKKGPLHFNRWRHEQELVDTKTGEVLARYVDFSSGNGNIGGELEMRFWLHANYCSHGDRNEGSMLNFNNSFSGE